MAKALWDHLINFSTNMNMVVEPFGNLFELLENVSTFGWKCCELIKYPDCLRKNMETLKRKSDALNAREEDIVKNLKHEEFRSQKRRKAEVDNWLDTVESKKVDVVLTNSQLEELQLKNHLLGDPNYFSCAKFLVQLGVRKFVDLALLGTCVDKHIQEIEELWEQGVFSEGLLLDTPQVSDNLLPLPKLVGWERTLGEIQSCLENDETIRIGVLGKEGVGKSVIIGHIYNELLRNTSNFRHVYLVPVSPEFSILELQDRIAKEINLDLSDADDEIKRAAKLQNALRKRNGSVLILDGLEKHFRLENAGLQLHANKCKLILTTRSQDVCRKMGCHQNIVRVEPLPAEKAEELFIDNLLAHNPLPTEVEQIAKLIARECGGLPGKIISMAESLRGEDDIAVWRNTLKEFKGHLHY
ncbi:disease resistance protein SUMM2-like [Malania oleifera]|uniref:disease resistance protein SUMM2-like n=1 Tax=Malania oleifera TaxID=397392 RepID=UPI0025AE5F45|nr:disease resistance protein SUMM2-like [Malania oleifera]